jgi:hypothetical protein
MKDVIFTPYWSIVCRIISSPPIIGSKRSTHYAVDSLRRRFIADNSLKAQGDISANGQWSCVSCHDRPCVSVLAWDWCESEVARTGSAGVWKSLDDFVGLAFVCDLILRKDFLPFQLGLTTKIGFMAVIRVAVT